MNNKIVKDMRYNPIIVAMDLDEGELRARTRAEINPIGRRVQKSVPGYLQRKAQP